VDKLPKAVALLGTNQTAAVFWRLQFLMKLMLKKRERLQSAWYRPAWYRPAWYRRNFFPFPSRKFVFISLRILNHDQIPPFCDST
jgi:hypothetical protein